MAKAKDTNDPKGVDEYIMKLDPSLAELVKAVRIIVLSTDKEIGEQIKWNAPAFFYLGTMKPFDAKEYKRDMIVMNISKGFLLLVFPTGARITGSEGLLEGDYKDGRRLVSIKNLNDVEVKKAALQVAIKKWLLLVEK